MHSQDGPGDRDSLLLAAGQLRPEVVFADEPTGALDTRSVISELALDG